MTRKKETVEHLSNGNYGYSYQGMTVKDGHLIKDTITESPYGETVKAYINMLKAVDEKYQDTTIELCDISSYGDPYQAVQISFWREMTEAELRKAQTFRAAALKKSKDLKLEKLERELKEYERLKKVFENE